MALTAACLCVLGALLSATAQAQSCGYGVGPEPDSIAGSGAPPYPPGATTYSCAAGGYYNQQSPYSAEPGSPWTAAPVDYGTEKITVTASIAATIKTVCNVSIAVTEYRCGLHSRPRRVYGRIGIRTSGLYQHLEVRRIGLELAMDFVATLRGEGQR